MLLRVCLGEMKKQKRNYFNTWSTYISLLFWPILTFVGTYFSYKNFDISNLNKLNIYSYSDLAIFLLTGALCYNCFWAMVQGAFFMLNERENGTLETIFLSPAPRISIMYGRAIGALFQSTWIMFMYSIIILIIRRGNILHAFLSIITLFLVVIISAIIWGGFINSIFTVSRDIDFWFTICDEPMKLLSGVQIPVSIFPIAFKYISAAFPLFYCLEITRNIFTNAQNSLLVLIKYIISNCIIIIITLFILKKAEKHNRETGSLQLY